MKKMLLTAVFAVVFGLPVWAQQKAVGLDQAIADAVQHLFDHLPEKSRTAFLGVSAPTQDLSGYVLRRLETQCAARFTIIERRNIELRMQEMNLSANMEVSQETELAIGKLLSAEYIVTGAVNKEGGNYSLEISPLMVESGETKPFHITIRGDDKQLLSLLEDRQQKHFSFSIGGRAGLALNFWALSDDIAGDVETPSAGFEPALQAAFYFNKFFAVQTELGLSINKVSYSGDDPKYSASFESYSFRIPILASFTYHDPDRTGIFSISAFAGIGFNIPLGDMNLKSDLYDDNSYRFSAPPYYVIGIKPGLRIGSGLVFMDIRFSGDFAKTVIRDDSGVLALYARNTLSLSLGFEFERDFALLGKK